MITIFLFIFALLIIFDIAIACKLYFKYQREDRALANKLDRMHDDIKASLRKSDDALDISRHINKEASKIDLLIEKLNRSRKVGRPRKESNERQHNNSKQV